MSADARRRLSVALDAELSALVDAWLADGRYADADALIADALRLLQRRDLSQAQRRAWMETAWREGMDTDEEEPDDAAGAEPAKG